MEAARHLHPVPFDPETGEVVCRECEAKQHALDVLQGKMVGMASEVGRLKNMLVVQRTREAQAEQIREVLEYWKPKCKPKALIKVGGKRWEKVRDRLEDDLDGRGPWTTEELCLAVEGALLDPWLNGSHSKSKGYLDAETVFRDSEQVERLVHLALGFKAEAKILPSGIPERVLRDFHFEPLLEECGCGHLRLEHSKADPFREGFQPCLVHGCTCTDFDDWHVERRDA